MSARGAGKDCLFSEPSPRVCKHSGPCGRWMLRMSLLSPLLLLLAVLAPPVEAQEPAQPGTAQSGTAQVSQSRIETLALPDAKVWGQWLERDRNLSFSARTTSNAREDLQQGGLGQDRQAAAWLGLAHSGAHDLRLTYERGAHALSGVRQLACIFALGALQEGTESVLIQLAEDPSETKRSAALLAMLATGRPSLWRWVEERALDARSRDQAAARAALALWQRTPDSAPHEIGKQWLALRFEAARHYGLIAGESWLVYSGRMLADDPGFLELFVLRSSARIARPGVRDLLLGVLQKSTGPERLRATVRGMPRELSRLVDSGLWEPADDLEWRLILDEVELYGSEAFVPELLQRGLTRPGIAWRAAALALRSGLENLGAFAAEDLAKLAVPVRIEALRALGEAVRPGSLQRVMPFVADGSAPVACAAQVAAMRLGVRSAEVSVRAAVDNAAHRLHKSMLVELTRVIRDPRAAGVLDETLRNLDGDLGLYVATALTRDGSRSARERVRAALNAQPPLESERAQVLVAALARRPSTEDLATLRAWFPTDPQPRSRALNLELASMLAQLSDPVVLPLLQAALWRDDFEISMLAAARMVELGGMTALRDAVLSPPPRARSEDVRRVGYGLGLWGGFTELETLSARLRHNSGAPAVQGALLGVLSTRTH